MSGIKVQVLDLIPTLYYDPKDIAKKFEEENEFFSHIDVLIDMSNHQTFIFE